MSQVQSDNDPSYVSTRQNNNAAGGFDVALEPEQAQTTQHGAAETIGYLAIEATASQWTRSTSRTC